MVLEPGVGKDHALLPEVRDGEECLFRVGLVIKDYIHYFRDLSCFVRGAVYVKHRYGARDALGANTLCTDKIFVYEVACGSGVQKRLDGVHFTGVGGINLYRQDDRCAAVTPYKSLGKLSDILHLNNKNNQLERQARPPKDVPLDA